MKKICPFFWLCFGSLFYILNSIFSVTLTLAADNLLLNPDFEEWNGNTPASWLPYNSNISTEISNQFKNGSHSALLKVATNKSSWLYQSINIIPNTSYQFSGLVKQLSGNSEVLLRLAWYCATCSAQMPNPPESIPVNNASSDYSEVFLEVTAPANAASAKARIVIRPIQESINNNVLVDNFTFYQIAALSSATPENQVSPAPSPIIDLSSSNEAVIGEPFKVSFTLKNFDPETEYFIKIRGGLEENSLGKIQTRAGESFLSDTKKWELFPVIKTDNSGTINSEVMGYLDEKYPLGKYKFMLRFYEKTTGTTIKSGFQEITFSAPAIIPEEPKIASPSPSISSPSSSISQDHNIPISSSSGSTLGTQSASISPPINSSTSAVLSPPSKTSSPSATSQSKKSQTNAFISQLLIMTGLVLSAIGLFRFSKKPKFDKKT